MNIAEDDPDPVRLRRAWFVRGFRDRYARGYVCKHFHAVRLSKASAPVPAGDVPLLVVLNHPSWWDPLVCTALSKLFGEREHYAAIHAQAIQRYGFFKWLGFYGVDPSSLRGAAAFVRTTAALLAKSHRAVWVTAQGRFTDVRTRPLGLQTGVGHVAARLAHGLILPLAVEYTYWTERTPEAMACFGTPIDVNEAPDRSGKGWTARIEAALTTTLDTLNADTASRDPARFTTLLTGRVGVGGAYDAWRRLKAFFTGHPFDPSHDAAVKP